MNKKVLSAILFSALFAGTGTFTSCIDTDEPAGIEELRGAKAELIRAKVSVEQANAAYKLAEAEVQKALAAKENALADIQKAAAEAARLANELLAAQNEAEKAAIQAELEAAKKDAELAALEHQKSVVEAKEALALAERQYGITIKQIEIAEALMNEGELQTIADLKAIVDEKQIAVNEAFGDVEGAERGVYFAAMNVDKDSEWWAETLALNLKYAEAGVKDAEELLAKYQGYVENLETADWLAEINEIEAELETIQKEYAKLDVEKTKAMNSEEFKAQVDSVRMAEEAVNAEIDTLNNLEFAEAVADTLLYYQGAQDVVFTVEGSKEGAVETLAGEDYLTRNADWTVEIADEYAGLIAELNEEISSYTTERKYWLDSIAAMGATADKEADAAAEKILKAYTDALAAYKNAYTVKEWAAEVKKVTDAKAAFDKAMAAADGENDAIKQYKAQIAAAEAYRKALVAYYTAGAKMSIGFNSFALPTYSSSTGVQNGYTSKTVQAWLADETAGAENLLTINKTTGSLYFIGNAFDGSKSEITYDDKKYAHCEKSAIAKLLTPTEILEILVAASTDAFGSAINYAGANVGGYDIAALQNGYLHKTPVLEDVKYVFSNGNYVGLYGTWMLADDDDTLFQAENYEAIIADLKAAVAKWTALVDGIVAEVETACADIKTAADAAEVAQDKFEAFVKAIEDEFNVAMADLGGKERALNVIKEKLAEYVDGELENGDYKELESWLKEQIYIAEYDLILAQEEVVAVEQMIKMAEDGRFDSAEALAAAEMRLKAAQDALTKAQTELDEAIANLAKALEIMSAE